jgi:hypothetical protein
MKEDCCRLTTQKHDICILKVLKLKYDMYTHK